MPLLYYWTGKYYYRDLERGVGYHLNQANPVLHSIDPGDSLWAFTRRRDGAYVLAAELVIIARTLNPPDFDYGRFRVWGDLQLSRYFVLDGQPDITLLIRGLSIKARGVALGSAFQGGAAVRPIGLSDHLILKRYAEDLPLEPLARPLPEERLEALVLAQDKPALTAFIREETPEYTEARIRHLTTTVFVRARENAAKLRDLYDGMCQLCLWAPRAHYGAELCEAHHIRWLSLGGEDALTNMVLICPNHHRAIHRCEAHFDWARNAFRFKDRIEPLVVLNHGLVG